VKVGRVAGDDVQEQVGEVEGHVPRIDPNPLLLEASGRSSERRPRIWYATERYFGCAPTFFA